MENLYARDVQLLARLQTESARCYWRAAQQSSGRNKGWALHNYARMCLELGRYRAAERAAKAARPLLARRDRHMHAAVEAHVAVKIGYPKRTFNIIDETLGDPKCPELVRAYLWYVEALNFERLGMYTQAEETLERAWRSALALNYSWLVVHLMQISPAIAAKKKGAS
ncbi:MAG TPA: hypothetical protein VGK74_13630 [Symbiobacteriaceae bacterium]